MYQNPLKGKGLQWGLAGGLWCPVVGRPPHWLPFAGGMYHGDLTDKLKALYKLHLPPGEGLLTSQDLSCMGWRPCCVAYSRSCSPWALCTVPELPRVTSRPQGEKDDRQQVLRPNPIVCWFPLHGPAHPAQHGEFSKMRFLVSTGKRRLRLG